MGAVGQVDVSLADDAMVGDDGGGDVKGAVAANEDGAVVVDGICLPVDVGCVDFAAGVMADFFCAQGLPGAAGQQAAVFDVFGRDGLRALAEQGTVVFDVFAVEVKGAGGAQATARAIFQALHAEVEADFAVDVAVVAEGFEFVPVDVVKAQDGTVGVVLNVQIKALAAEAAADVGVFAADDGIGGVNVARAAHGFSIRQQAAGAQGAVVVEAVCGREFHRPASDDVAAVCQGGSGDAAVRTTACYRRCGRCRRGLSARGGMIGCAVLTQGGALAVVQIGDADVEAGAAGLADVAPVVECVAFKVQAGGSDEPSIVEALAVDVLVTSRPQGALVRDAFGGDVLAA